MTKLTQNPSLKEIEARLNQVTESNTPYRERHTKWHHSLNNGTPLTFNPKENWIFMNDAEPAKAKILAIGEKAAKTFDHQVGDNISGGLLRDFKTGGTGKTAWFSGPDFKEHLKASKSDLAAEWKRLGYGPEGEILTNK